MVDEQKKNSHNSDRYFVFSNGEETTVINKRDLNFVSTGGHEHQYLPDFTDEWESAIAVKCAVRGCVHGRMMRKEGKEFMEWLEGHRAKA